MKRIARYRWLLVATMLVSALALAGCVADPTPTPNPTPTATPTPEPTPTAIPTPTPEPTPTAIPTPTPVPSPTPTVIRATETIHAGRSVYWDLSDFEACRYHFTVRQTGTFGSVDIGFQGQRYTEKDGVFYGDMFTLSNGYSAGTAKVVDVTLRCQ